MGRKLRTDIRGESNKLEKSIERRWGQRGTKRDGKERSDVRYYIRRLKPGVKRLAAAVRGHWGIENTLHWTLDVTFNEDQSRIRKGYGADNFALLRRFAVSLVT